MLCALVATLAVAALACGGRKGGDYRPSKVKTIVEGAPEGYDPAVAASLGFWSSRWQVLQYALMSGAGETTSFESSTIEWMKFRSEPGGGSDPAAVPENAAYLLVPFRYGVPTYAAPLSDGDFHDYGDERWSSADPDSGYDILTTATLIMAEVEWARQFHSAALFGTPQDSEHGSTERFTGMLLAEMAKRSAMHYLNNRDAYSGGTEAKLRMIAALADLVRLLREPSLGGSGENRYRDVNFSAQLLAWMDFMFDEYTGEPAPSTAEGLCEAITALGWYVTATLDAKLREQGLSLMRTYADSLAEMESADPVDAACRIRGLVEAGRLLFDSSYYTTASQVFEEMQKGYDPETGTFAGRATFTAAEIARVVGALNALRSLASGYADTEWAQLVMSDFIAAAVYMSGLCRSTFPITVVEEYERPSDPLHYSFPGVPENRADGVNIAPCFGWRVVKRPDGRGWSLDGGSFDAAGALALALELLWLRPTEYDPWPDYNGGVAAPLVNGRGDFTYPVALSEAYFTGRSAAVEFALKSVAGESFQLPPETAAEVLAAAGSPSTGDTAAMPKNLQLLRLPYELASPAWGTAFNGDMDDYSNFRWTTAGTDVSEEALAALMIVEARLAAHFQDSRRFGEAGVTDYGANERLKGYLLYHALRKQVSDLSGGAFNLPRTVEGRCALLEALCEAADLFSAESLPGCDPNPYRDPALHLATEQLIEATWSYLADQNPPADMEGLRTWERAMLRYAVHVTDPDRAEAARRAVLDAVDAAMDLAPADVRDKADLFCMLFDAVRLDAGGEYEAEMRKVFVLLLDEYDPAYGYFSSKERYTAEDAAAVMEALLAADEADEKLIDLETRRNMLRGFVEGTLMLSGFVRSAWMAWQYPAYETPLEDLWYRYPTLPYPFYAGGEHGVAPVFAGQVEFVPYGGYWNVLDTLSHTTGTLRMCDVLLRCNREQIPSLEIPSHLR